MSKGRFWKTFVPVPGVIKDRVADARKAARRRKQQRKAQKAPTIWGRKR